MKNLHIYNNFTYLPPKLGKEGATCLLKLWFPGIRCQNGRDSRFFFYFKNKFYKRKYNHFKKNRVCSRHLKERLNSKLYKCNQGIHLLLFCFITKVSKLTFLSSLVHFPFVWFTLNEYFSFVYRNFSHFNMSLIWFFTDRGLHICS